MPDDYYVSQYSGEEIDDAITRALPGGAIDITLANKAPAGFGSFGEVQPIVDINNDETAFNIAIDGLLSGMKDCSSMQIRFANYPVYGEDGTIFSGFLYKSTNNYAVLHGTNYNGGSIQKAKSGGIWKPWEWVNPPMVLGVEYRTTERYKGKPVYTMAVDCKSGPTAGNVTATYIGIGETVAAENVLSVDAFCGGGYTIPPGSHYTSVGLYVTAKPSVGVNPKNQITVYVRTSENVSDQHIYAVIKYTKTE